ncbi:MAG TPA: HdeD family acid-resistance protein [Alphaproteobacteria bacterium]
MLQLMAKNWWALALRGAAAVLFGILALLWPGLTLDVLILVFGAYALVDGIFAIVAAVRAAGRHERWGAPLLEGIVSILAGVIAVVAPLAAAFGFFLLFVAWTILTGVLEIVAAAKLRREIKGEWLLIVSGVLSILLGIFFAAYPGIAIVTMVWCIGIYAILFGILLLVLAFRLRKLAPA